MDHKKIGAFIRRNVRTVVWAPLIGIVTWIGFTVFQPESRPIPPSAAPGAAAGAEPRVSSITAVSHELFEELVHGCIEEGDKKYAETRQHCEQELSRVIRTGGLKDMGDHYAWTESVKINDKQWVPKVHIVPKHRPAARANE